MSVLHYALVKNVGEGLANRFVDNIEDVYNVGYKQAGLDCALKMKNDGLQTEIISRYTGICAEEIEKL